MRAAEKMAEEIYQVYSSGKCGIVLEMGHRQEWEPVTELLYRNYFKGKTAPYMILRYGEKTVSGKVVYAPVVCQGLNIQRRLPDDVLGLADVHPASYAAVALEKLAGEHMAGFLIVEDFQQFDRENQIRCVSALSRFLKTESADGRMLILLTVDRIENLPDGLFPYVHVIHGEKPGPVEIRENVEELLARRNLKIEENFKHEIVSYLQGFQCFEMDYLMQRAERMYGEEAFDPQRKRILELIGSEKGKLLEKDKLLEWKMVRHVDMANMERLEQYLRESGRIMSSLQEAGKQGVDVPKGILIMGLPGTGKSLFAQYAAAELKMPLIRLEMGRMMGGHVGDSERNLRNAQRQAEEMAPCILWIDEIEKGFAGSGGGGNGDSAYLKRMTGSFLTWLQEKKSSCYIIATANSIAGLPPEFFRKGRFDECFFTSMPTEKELRGILMVHLQKPERVHVQPVAEAAVDELIAIATAEKRFMTGADASALVSAGFRRLYLDYGGTADREAKEAYDREHLSEVLLREFRKMKVFSETNAEEIARYSQSSLRAGFSSASCESDAEDGKSRYDNRLDAFIKMEIEKLKNI